MPDVTGWTEEQIQRWERDHQQFATDDRADAAADVWNRENLTPDVLAESECWRRFYDEEAGR